MKDLPWELQALILGKLMLRDWLAYSSSSRETREVLVFIEDLCCRDHRSLSLFPNLRRLKLARSCSLPEGIVLPSSLIEMECYHPPSLRGVALKKLKCQEIDGGELAEQTSLTSLTLYEAEETRCLLHLPLRSLTLKWVTHREMPSLLRLTSLTKLDMSGRQRASYDFSSFSLLKKLKIRNPGIVILNISTLTNLVELSAYNLKDSDIAPLTHLKKLGANNSPLTNEAFRCLGGLSRLSIYQNSTVSDTIFGFISLKGLEFWSCRFYDLSSQTRLEKLYYHGLSALLMPSSLTSLLLDYPPAVTGRDIPPPASDNLTDSYLFPLTSLTRLILLNPSPLTDASLSRLVNLVELNCMSPVGFTDTGLVCLTRLESLSADCFSSPAVRSLPGLNYLVYRGKVYDNRRRIIDGFVPSVDG